MTRLKRGSLNSARKCPGLTLTAALTESEARRLCRLGVGPHLAQSFVLASQSDIQSVHRSTDLLSSSEARRRSRLRILDLVRR